MVSTSQAQRRIEELEGLTIDLTTRVDELKAQKLLRQQMGSRRPSKSSGKGHAPGGSKISMRVSSTSTTSSASVADISAGGSRFKSSSGCPQCPMLEEMLAAARKQISEVSLQSIPDDNIIMVIFTYF